MRRFFWTFLLLLLIFPQSTAAQSTEWENGCTPQVSAMIAPLTRLDYSAACKTYTDCLNDVRPTWICQMRAWVTLSEGCADSACQLEANWYAATLNIVDFGFFRNFEYVPKETLWERVYQVLFAFHDGNYAEALAVYQSALWENYVQPNLPLSIGLLYEALGYAENALASYDQAVQVSYLTPLAYYLRGQLYARQQRTEEAAVDFSVLAQYLQSDSMTNDLIVSLTTAYPLSAISFENWMVYPVARHSGGPGGSYYQDQSLQSAYPARLAWISNHTRIVAQNLSSMIARYYNGFPNTLILNRSGENTYTIAVSYSDDYGDWGGGLRLNLADGRMEVSENDLGFESESASASLAAPAGQPDPRLFFAAPRCSGAALSRLSAGVQAYFSGVDNEVNVVYDQPSGTVIGSDYSMTVLDGPLCQNQQAWWQVQLGSGETGWINESDGQTGEYHAFPAGGVLLPPYCDVTLAPRLTIDGRGSVAVGLDSNNLRDNPTTSAAKIGILPEGAIFEVLMGPVCADGYAWWQVRYQELIGWTAEGQGYTYWLQPES